MSYVNPAHHGRMLVIPQVRDAFAEIYVATPPMGAAEIQLAGAASIVIFQGNELAADYSNRDIYNFPYLLHKDGTPWYEANSYHLNLLRNKSLSIRHSDDLRRRASKLLDYLLFCESRDLDWLDFTGKRPSLRPTYKYYAHLLESSGRCNAVINQYTGVVFEFYKFVCGRWHDIDINRVDLVKEVGFIVNGERGSTLIKTTKRSQTAKVPPKSTVSIGYVRDEGEDLRPLSNRETAALLSALEDDGKWTQVDRLIILTSLMTGARKQTVLTLRIRHFENLCLSQLNEHGEYAIHVGPGTGVDTKKNKPQVLYFPRQLAEELAMLASSQLMIRRRKKFMDELKKTSPFHDFDERDSYLFLSDQGGCYYMARDDPRYLAVRSKPAGQVTDHLRRKIISAAQGVISKSFTYHWLRATYAFQLYQRLQPMIAKGIISSGEDISFIQSRMHHNDRLTTENYLKLFKMHSQKLLAQEAYETELFKFESYADLVIERHLNGESGR